MADEEILSYSVASIAQFSGIRSDPYTVHAGVQLFQNFQLSNQGQRNVINAFTNLPVFNVFDDSLSFGFGLEHILRNDMINRSGFTLAAFNSAISECFPENYGAAIMDELAKMANPPLDTTPHLYQWQNLLLVFDGSFAPAGFGVLVEDFMRLNPYNTASAQSLATPKAFAQTLKQIGDISGRSKEMTIVGGKVAGWFAAVAEWLFDLRVKIMTEDGTQLYQSTGSEDAQVTIIYIQVEHAALYVQEQGGHLKNVAILDAVTDDRANLPQYVPFGGRVTWQSLLPKVFGKAFTQLAHEDIGTAIGSIARIFEGLTRGEGDLNPAVVSERNKATPASYGAGLVATITNYLPELRRFAGKMERATKLSWEEAIKVYPAAIRKMEKSCACNICSSDRSSDLKPPENGFCHSVILETIVALGLALSKMIISPELFPARSGLHLFYAEQAQKKIELREGDSVDVFLTIYGNGWNAPDSVMLRKCVEIFSGFSPDLDLHENLVALSHEGVCAYLIKLEGSSASDRPGGSSIMRVVAGTIQKKSKVYTRVREGSVPEDLVTWDLWEEVQCASGPPILYCK